MNRPKKIISFLLAVLMAVSYVPATVLGLEPEPAEETEHSHSYTANVTIPTCTELGYTTYICDCGERYVADYVSARGHDYADEKCLHCGSTWPEKLLHLSFDDTIGALKDLTENADK